LLPITARGVPRAIETHRYARWPTATKRYGRSMIACRSCCTPTNMSNGCGDRSKICSRSRSVAFPMISLRYSPRTSFGCKRRLWLRAKPHHCSEVNPPRPPFLQGVSVALGRRAVWLGSQFENRRPGRQDKLCTQPNHLTARLTAAERLALTFGIGSFPTGRRKTSRPPGTDEPARRVQGGEPSKVKNDRPESERQISYSLLLSRGKTKGH
jgi:hypothetical protein